jgi:hypothetical protein
VAYEETGHAKPTYGEDKLRDEVLMTPVKGRKMPKNKNMQTPLQLFDRAELLAQMGWTQPKKHNKHTPYQLAEQVRAACTQPWSTFCSVVHRAGRGTGSCTHDSLSLAIACLTPLVLTRIRSVWSGRGWDGDAALTLTLPVGGGDATGDGPALQHERPAPGRTAAHRRVVPRARDQRPAPRGTRPTGGYATTTPEPQGNTERKHHDFSGCWDAPVDCRRSTAGTPLRTDPLFKFRNNAQISGFK